MTAFDIPDGGHPSGRHVANPLAREACGLLGLRRGNLRRLGGDDECAYTGVGDRGGLGLRGESLNRELRALGGIIRRGLVALLKLIPWIKNPSVEPVDGGILQGGKLAFHFNCTPRTIPLHDKQLGDFKAKSVTFGNDVGFEVGPGGIAKIRGITVAGTTKILGVEVPVKANPKSAVLTTKDGVLGLNIEIVLDEAKPDAKTTVFVPLVPKRKSA